jgi:hypothetical protein
LLRQTGDDCASSSALRSGGVWLISLGARFLPDSKARLHQSQTAAFGNPVDPDPTAGRG